MSERRGERHESSVGGLIEHTARMLHESRMVLVRTDDVRLQRVLFSEFKTPNKKRLVVPYEAVTPGHLLDAINVRDWARDLGYPVKEMLIIARTDTEIPDTISDRLYLITATVHTR